MEKDKAWRSEIESQLFRIKIMLIVLLNLNTIGFYILTQAEGDLTIIAKLYIGIGFLVTLIILLLSTSAISASVKKEIGETNQN